MGISCPPILLMIYNRLDTTEQVFNKIREAQPDKLFIAADGPSDNKINDEYNCNKVRNYLLNNIDWECEVHTLFRLKNIGVNNAILEAIDWFFESVEYGIILEDDCVPNSSFFTYCKLLLDKYADDERVAIVSGTNPACSSMTIADPYYFSYYPNFQAWATWKRVWKEVDYLMPNYPKLRKLAKSNVTFKKMPLLVKMRILADWDFAYYIKDSHGCYSRVFWSLFIKEFIGIIPRVNLVSNIGFIGIHGDWTWSPVVGVPASGIEELNREGDSNTSPSFNDEQDIVRMSIQYGLKKKNGYYHIIKGIIRDNIKITSYKNKVIYLVLSYTKFFDIYKKIKHRK